MCFIAVALNFLSAPVPSQEPVSWTLWPLCFAQSSVVSALVSTATPSLCLPLVMVADEASDLRNPVMVLLLPALAPVSLLAISEDAAFLLLFLDVFPVSVEDVPPLVLPLLLVWAKPDKLNATANARSIT